MELQEAKEKIRIESADPAENQRLKAWIMDPNDCFGRGYTEGGKYCRECTVLTDFCFRKDQLWVFCKELTPIYGPNVDPGKEEEGLKEESKATKRFRRF